MKFWLVAAGLVIEGTIGCGSSREEAQAPTEESAVTIAGGSGARCDVAIQISAPTQRIGVQAEYDWLEEHRNGYKIVKRAEIDCAGVPNHQLTIVLPDGRHEDVFFDASNYVGKL